MFRKICKEEVIESLKRHKDLSSNYVKEISKISKSILENVGTDQAKKAVSLSQEVESDLHSHKAFLRLSVSQYGILYAKLSKMQHYNEIPLLEFFRARFPTFVIVFESKRGVFISKKNEIIVLKNKTLIDVLSELEKELPLNPALLELHDQDHENLWESFARSQLIKEAKESKQVINLSKRWKKTVPLDTLRYRTLDEF